MTGPTTEETVVLEPLPCWRLLPPEEIQERVRHMVREIEEETAERHRRNGTQILGRKAAQRVHPHDRPESPKRGPRPAFHAATREVREGMKQAYREFAEYFRAAAHDLRAGMKDVKFQPGSFPPGLLYPRRVCLRACEGLSPACGGWGCLSPGAGPLVVSQGLGIGVSGLGDLLPCTPGGPCQ